jgi:hypothetical protein
MNRSYAVFCGDFDLLISIIGSPLFLQKKLNFMYIPDDAFDITAS